MDSIKHLFCRHKWKLNRVHPVHGPIENKPLFSKLEWKCSKCGKLRYDYAPCGIWEACFKSPYSKPMIRIRRW